MMTPKSPKPIRSPRHLRFIRELPCAVCWKTGCEAAHVRYGDTGWDKPHTPMARRPSDNWAVPLCSEHHRTGDDAQHRTNEREWWIRQGIDPLRLARALWNADCDLEAGYQLIRDARLI